MAISFNSIPSDTRVPLFYAEMDNSAANTARDSGASLLIGHASNDASIAVNSLVLVSSVDYARQICGAGSQLARMVGAYRKTDPFGELYVIAVPESTGAAATVALTVTGEATETGTVNVYTGRTRVQAPVTSGDDAAAVAVSIKDAVNANPDLPFTATSEAGVVTLTARHKGLYLARNMLPDMCDEDWLYRHARIKRCPRKNAVSAKGFARWDGIAGTPEIPAGTQIQRDDQVTFTTLQTVKASGGLLRVPVIADVAGTAGNTDDGTALRLGTPITGIPSTGYADTLTGGADTEELETWRARVMERYYWIPQGGADPDYVIWAKEIAGITRAWIFRHYKGTGTVGVMVATSNPVNPAPGDDLVKAVRDHILPLAPVAGGGLFVFAATEKSIPVTVALAKDTPEIRTAIIAELNALMLRDGAPSGKIYVSRISEAISLATGEVAHQLRVPAADVVLGKTELPVLGNIIWATYTGENG